ncbi:MAG: hypothetical protein AB8G26_18860 [Ilumatobacter sp.]
MSRSRPGRLLTTLGVLLLIAGLVGAVVLVFAAGERRANAVEGFARAPVGCDTTLDFAESGEYFVYVERIGSIAGVRGDCDAPETYELSDDSVSVDITLVDPDGAPLDVDRALDDIDYDVDGFAGSARFVIDIAVSGDHVMRVESDSSGFAVAIGPDPSQGATALIGGAVAAALVGLLVGGLLILIGRKRARSIAPVAAQAYVPPPFTPVGHAPQGPPTYTQPGGPVAYGQPEGSSPPPAWQQPPSAPTSPPGAFSAPPPPPAPGSPQPPAPAAPPSWAPAPPPPAPSVPAPSAAPQIPGEPMWLAPGSDSAPPSPAPAPPDAGRPVDQWAQSAPGSGDPDATIRIQPSQERADQDSTVERPAQRDAPPPPPPQ